MIRIVFVLLLMAALGWAVGVRVHPESLQYLAGKKKVYSRKVKAEPFVTWRMEDSIFQNIVASEQTAAKKELLGDNASSLSSTRPASATSSSSDSSLNPGAYLNLARKTRDQASQRNDGI